MDRRRLPDVEVPEIHPVRISINAHSDIHRYVLVNNRGDEDRVLMSCGTTTRYFEIVNECYNKYCDQQNIPLNKRMVFGKKRPPQDAKGWMDQGYIQCRTITIIPGSMSQQHAPYSGRRLRAWRHYGSYKDPEQTDRQIIIEHRPFDAWVGFDLYIKGEDTADRKADWFITFMDEFAFYFAFQGVKKQWFERRDEDRVWQDSGYPQPFAVRPLVYYVRLDKVRTRSCAILNSVNIDLAVKMRNDTEVEISGGKHTSLYRQTGDTT